MSTARRSKRRLNSAIVLGDVKFKDQPNIYVIIYMDTAISA
jgi:hypothetical protein